MVEIPGMVKTQPHLADAVSIQRRRDQMKIKLLTAVACGVLANAAQAQSSVTLYGALDTAIGYVSNQPKANGGTGSAFQMINGTLSANSWGLKGTEDLGGGLSAVFRLENGFVLSNGALNNNGREFGRERSARHRHARPAIRSSRRPCRTADGGRDLRFGVRDAGRSRQLRREPRRQ
jgi:hypothetical protein